MKINCAKSYKIKGSVTTMFLVGQTLKAIAVYYACKLDDYLHYTFVSTQGGCVTQSVTTTSSSLRYKYLPVTQ